MARRTISCVIPTLNEERNIGWVMSRIPAWVDEVVIVDGRSVDRTVEIAQSIRSDVVVVRERSKGKGAALCTGFAQARGDYVVILDADGSMDPAEIEYYVAVLDHGYEFAKGSRFLRGGGSVDLTRVRTFGNSALKSAVNLLWRVAFTDLCYGYLAFHRDVLPRLAPKAPGFEIEAELIARALNARLSIAEVPSVELNRHYGESNLHAWRDGLRILRTIVAERLRRNRPRHTHADRARNLRIVRAFDHVAVRGLRREPLASLSRASRIERPVIAAQRSDRGPGHALAYTAAVLAEDGGL